MTERKITKSDCKYYRESDGNCLNFTYVGEYDPCTDGDLEHCYEKFPHFFNKDERMTEKRFINDIDNGRLIDTKGELSTINYSDKVDFYELWEFLNKLNDENEQLKQHNVELINKIDFLERVIDGDV